MAKTVTYVTRLDIYKTKYKTLPLNKLKLKHFLLNFNTIAESEEIWLVSTLKENKLKRLK